MPVLNAISGFKNYITVVTIIITICICSCSDGSNTVGDKEKPGTSTASTSPKKENTEIDNAAKDVCNCFADFENSISENGKKVFMEEAKNRTDKASEKLDAKDREIFLTKGVSAYECLKALEKKYTFLTDYTDDQINQFNEAIKKTCSEFVATVMTVK